MKMDSAPKITNQKKQLTLLYCDISDAIVPAVVIATIELAKLSGFSFIAGHRNVIVSIELTIFVMILVEVIGGQL